MNILTVAKSTKNMMIKPTTAKMFQSLFHQNFQRCISSSTNTSVQVQTLKQKQYQIMHTLGILGAFSCITAAVAMSPLDEFEKLDPKNDCYHRHLHPRWMVGIGDCQKSWSRSQGDNVHRWWRVSPIINKRKIRRYNLLTKKGKEVKYAKKSIDYDSEALTE